MQWMERGRMVQTTVGRKQTEESKRGSKGEKQGSRGFRGEVDVRVTSLRKRRDNEVKENKKRNQTKHDGTRVCDQIG